MRKLILALSLIAAIIGAYYYTAKPATCAWCSPVPCYGSCYGSSCVCIKAPGEFSGSCYSIGN